MKLKNYDNLFQNSYGKKSSINKKQAQNIAKSINDKPIPIPIPIPVATPTPPPPTTNATPSSVKYAECNCGVLCYFDFKKMIKCNKSNGKKHWCPNGDLPVPTKCSHCGCDIFFDRLCYDDIRGLFIPLSREEDTGAAPPHRCLNKKKMLI